MKYSIWFFSFFIPSLLFASYKETKNIHLTNGIQALLISDSHLTKSACALSVGVGSWDDPVTFPGMAHFIEHLVFLGTKSFPEESDLVPFAQERGGECNAVTFRDQTVYGFSIHPQFFVEGLDRFSELFFCPQFSSSAIDREKHAIHHEFEDAIENSFLRIWRVFKETGAEHPNKQFSCGNLSSLRGLQQEDVLTWFHKYYRPNHMRLVLMGPSSISDLEESAAAYFSRIPPSSAHLHEEKEHRKNLSSSEQKGHFIYLEPTYTEKMLCLCWEIPEEFMGENQRALFSLGQTLLNHNYPHGLFKVLEEEGLAVDVQSDFWRVAKGKGMFRVNIVLTAKGVESYERVIRSCFCVFQGLEQTEIPDYFLKKMIRFSQKRLHRVSGEVHKAMELAEEFQDALFNLNEESLLSEKMMLDITHRFFHALSPKDCIYFLIGDLKEWGVFSTRIEPWMGVKYTVRRVPEKMLQEWSLLSPLSFIGYSPQRDSPDLRNEVFDTGFLEKPIFIEDHSRAKIRLMEKKSLEGVIEAFFCVQTPLMRSSVEYAASYALFVPMVERALYKELLEYPDVEWRFSLEENTFCLFIRASKENIYLVYKKIFNMLASRFFSLEEFEEAKKAFILDCSGDPEPLEYAEQVFRAYLYGFYYTHMELHRQVVELSYIRWQDFRNKCFDHMFIEGTFLGTITQEEAMTLSSLVQDSFMPYQGYVPDKDEEEEKKAGDGIFYCTTHRWGNALLLAIPVKDVMETRFLRMAETFLKGDFFKELRTAQQVAYRLYVRLEEISGQHYYSFYIQSSTHDPHDLLQRTKDFIEEFYRDLEQKISEERFQCMYELLGDSSAGSYHSFLSQLRKVLSCEQQKIIIVMVEGESSRREEAK